MILAEDRYCIVKKYGVIGRGYDYEEKKYTAWMVDKILIVSQEIALQRVNEGSLIGSVKDTTNQQIFFEKVDTVATGLSKRNAIALLQTLETKEVDSFFEYYKVKLQAGYQLEILDDSCCLVRSIFNSRDWDKPITMTTRAGEELINKLQLVVLPSNSRKYILA